MDKETISNYGWIILSLIIASLVIALASPFGHYMGNMINGMSSGVQSKGDAVGYNDAKDKAEALFDKPANAVDETTTYTHTLDVNKKLLKVGGNIDGTDIYWDITQDGILYIWGNGSTPAFTSTNVPWAEYNKSNAKGAQIKTVYIENTVKCSNIDYWFYQSEFLTECIINQPITNASQTFYACKELKKVEFSKSVTYNMGDTFYNCPKLEALIFKQTITSLSYNLINNINSFTAIDIGTWHGLIPIKTGDNQTVEMFGGYRTRYLYIPSSSYTAAFYSSGSIDTYGRIHSISGSQLATNDDGNGSLQFLVTYSVSANTPYILEAGVYSDNVNRNGIITVYLS